MDASQKPNGAKDGPPQIPENETIKTPHTSDAKTGAATNKKKKREKLSFVDFLTELKRSASFESAKQRFPALMKALKSGYKGKIALPDVESIFGVLRGCPECSRVALRLALLSRGKKPLELTRFLCGRLRSHARFVTGYPEKLESEGQDQRRETLLRWLQQVPKGSNEQGSQLSSTERAHWVLTLLMEEPLLIRADAIYSVLEQLTRKPEQMRIGETDNRFLVEVEKLAAAEKPNAHRIEAGLILAEGARSCSFRLREELLTAESTVKIEQARVAELREMAKTLEQRLAEATANTAALEMSLRDKTLALEKEQKERGLDGEHWRMQSEQRLTRMAQDITSRLSHEIREAKLCLSGDSPNLQMALDRLAQMEEALAKLRAR